ncbi:MAG: hypothetical protein RDV41_11710 [Planctomycetota bacterium]|nr:hypothetical protein [Planctomycetota bacterium]
MGTMHPQRGSVLVVVLFVIAIMIAFTATYVAVSARHSQISGENVSATRAFYAAESGLDACLSELNNAGDGSVVFALPSVAGQGISSRAADESLDGIDNNDNGLVDDDTELGAYTGAWYQAKPAGAFQYFPWSSDGQDNDNDGQTDEWDEKDHYLGEVLAAGSASGYVVTVRAKISGTRASAFSWAMFGDEYVTITGADALTDSYHSGRGTYDSQLTTWDDNDLDDDGDTAVDEEDERTHANLEGDVGTNGVVTLNGQPLLFGDLSYFDGMRLGQGAVCGEIGKLPTPIVLDPIPQADIDAAAASNDNAGIMVQDGPGAPEPINPVPGDLNIGPNDTCILAPGTYYFTSMTVKGDVQIDGSVTIYCVGDIDFQASSNVFNTGQKPTDLTILSTGDEIKLCANVDFYGAIYAPNAYIDINSNFSDFYGSVVGKGIMMAGNAAFHYDEALAEDGWSPRFLWAIQSWEIRSRFSAEARVGSKSFEDYHAVGQ